MTNELQAAKDYAPAQTLPPVVRGDFRPRIFLPGDNRLVNDFAADLGRELAKPRKFFRRGNFIVVVDDCAKELRSISAEKFVTEIEKHVVCQKFVSEQRGGVADCTISKSLSDVVLASDAFANELPEIERVNRVRLPVFRIRDEETLPALELLPAGYDAEEKTYTFEDAAYGEVMPIDEARRVWLDWTKDIAWTPGDRERSLAVLTAMALSPYCDQLITDRAPRPSFCFDANAEGAGKSTAAMLAWTPVFGAVSFTSPPNADKMLDTLNSVAQSGVSYVIFDNWRGKIENQALEAYISAHRWHGRVLGSAKTFDVDKHCLVCITANNAHVGPDMRRRLLFIHLFVEELRTENRRVSREICQDDILAGRAEMLAAMWSFVRHWRDAVFFRGRISRSFPQWSEIVGGVVECVCGQSPVAPAQIERDEILDSFEAFVAKVVDEGMLDDDLKPSGLVELARLSGAFPMHVLSDDAENLSGEAKRTEAIRFGKKCESLLNRRFDVPGRPVWFTYTGKGHTRRYRISSTRPNQRP